MSSNKSNCLDIILICSTCILAIALIASYIAYIVFGIMYLIDDKEFCNQCSGSSLWAYVLTAVILSLFRFIGAKNANDNKDSGNVLCNLVCFGLIECGLAIWGGMELWVNSCDNLIQTNIWNFGLATFCIQTFTASICLVLLPCMYIFMS